MGRFLAAALLVGTALIVVTALPDLARYIKIRSM